MSGRWVASPRRRRRNLLLLAGLLPSIVALTVGTALLLMLVRQAAGVAATEDGEHGQARERFAANRWIGTVERWVAPYNEGVATFREGAYADALEDFRAALLDVPPEHECLVLHNIAVTRERLGDLEADGGGEADDAMDQYRAGREVLADGPCLRPEMEGGEADVADRGRPEELLQGLPSATRQLDAQLMEKIRDLLAARDQLDRADLSPEELAAVERLERQEERAERREQRARARLAEQQAPAAPDDEQPREPGVGSGGEVYGW